MALYALKNLPPIYIQAANGLKLGLSSYELLHGLELFYTI